MNPHSSACSSAAEHGTRIQDPKATQPLTPELETLPGKHARYPASTGWNLALGVSDVSEAGSLKSGLGAPLALAI